MRTNKVPGWHVAQAREGEEGSSKGVGEMTVKNGDKSAMPTHDVYQDCGIDGNSGPYLTQTTSYGLTKREMMAMAAMQGLVANSSGGYSDYKYMAEDAVRIADTLLAELERTK